MAIKRSMLAVAVSAAMAVSSAALADNWPHFRGPNYNGSSGEKGLPTEFSKDKGVKWSTELPGVSAATPVVWGDKVFITAGDEEKQKLHAICIDKNTGKIVWDNIVGEGYRRDNKSTFASPSAVTDGKNVFFFFGQGDLAAYTMDGKKIWQRNLQADFEPFAFNWTFSTSPTLYNGVLYMQVLQRDVQVDPKNRLNARAEGQKGIDSYLLAVDPATGKDLWKHVRPAPAVAESREAFTTPIPFEYNGRAELLLAGGDVITGHDPKTGKELWRSESWNREKIPHWRLVGSPVAGDGVVLVSPPKGNPVIALEAGATGTPKVLWVGDKIDKDLTSDVATPLFYEHKFIIQYGDKKQKFISAVEPKTGKVIWKTAIDSGRYIMRSSPTGADGKIYTMDHHGVVYVFSAADGKLLNKAEFGEKLDDDTMSSISVSGGDLFIRTNTKLFCIGK